MRMPKWTFLILILVLMAGAGCVRAARNTEGFATSDSVTVNKAKDEAWQVAKDVLREQKFDIYTRDKRGVFVAYSPMKRDIFLVPHRVKYTIALEGVSDTATKVTVESVRQVYGVTPLTYPDWHDRKTTGNRVAQKILSDIQAKTS